MFRLRIPWDSAELGLREINVAWKQYLAAEQVESGTTSMPTLALVEHWREQPWWEVLGCSLWLGGRVVLSLALNDPLL